MKDSVKKWVAALRSGEYRQTQGLMGVEDEDGNASFCCLGVATELYMQEHPEALRRDVVKEGVNPFCSARYEYSMAGHNQCKSDTLLPPVIEWLGLKDDCGTHFADFPDYERTASLAEANDGGASFDEIANFIETDPKGLLR